MELVKEDSAILRQEMEEFNFEDPPTDPLKLEENLVEFMVENGGVGLSANQLGLPYRVFVFGDPKSPESCSAVFNPKIVHTEGPEVGQDEGCLSFPGLNVRVYRPNVVRIRYQDSEGKTQTQKFGGLTSRIVQHETDHLNGVLFTDRAKKFHLDRANRKRKIELRKRK